MGPDTYIPRDSLVTMKCIGERNQGLEWAITLPGHQVPAQFSLKEVLCS